MKDPDLQNQPSSRSIFTMRSPQIAIAVACVFFGAVAALGIRALWQLGAMPVSVSLAEEMMHRKTRTMEHVLDGLVRGNLREIESSAERMWDIGNALNWYGSNPLYADHDEIFRDSTVALIEAARQRDYPAAKESALRLERSCMECHALINSDKLPSVPLP